MKKENTKDAIIRKLTSRKLWMSICAFVSLIAVALGLTENEAAQITAIIMAGAQVVGYIIGEGLVDAKNNSGDTTEVDENAD